MPQLLYPQGKSTQYPLDRSIGLTYQTHSDSGDKLVSLYSPAVFDLFTATLESAVVAPPLLKYMTVSLLLMNHILRFTVTVSKTGILSLFPPGILKCLYTIENHMFNGHHDASNRLLEIDD
jgi:hypothetical protein